MKRMALVCALLITLSLLLTACSLNPLVGTWSTTIDGAQGQMILNRRGVGEIVSHGVARPCTWSAENDTLTVVQDVKGIPYTFLDGVTYSIEGRTMTITSQGGNTLVFEKQ